MTPDELFGVALIVLALVLFLLEVKAPGLGVLGVGGALALAVGVVLLLGTSSIPLLIGIGLPLMVLVAFIAVLAHRARRSKVVTGDAGMVGLEGRAETALLPEGKVLVRGELWDAWSPTRIEQGTAVKVVGVNGLRLEVASARAIPPPPPSLREADDE